MILRHFNSFTFRLFIFPLIRADLFDCLYSDVDSRPATPPQITVSLLLIQSFFDKTDDEMHDWMMGNDIAIRFATDTLGYSSEKLPTCDKQLSRFRRRCEDYANSHDGKNPLEECLRNLEYGMCAFMGLDLKHIRMDSTQISANMARLSREELVYTENQRMLKYLVAQQNPEKNAAIEKNGLGHYLEANDKNKVIFHSHIRKENKQRTLAEEASRILAICTKTDLDSQEGKLFTRILSEQTVVENNVRRFATKEDGTMTSSCVQNPVDPDATYRVKAGKEFIGYVTNFAEAVGTEGSQVVSWDFKQNVINDPVMSLAFLQESEAIISGIENYNRILGIETPGNMKECRDVLQKKMKVVKERILAAVRSGRKIPRSMDADPLYEETDKRDCPDEQGRQMTIDDLLSGLNLNVTQEQLKSNETKENSAESGANSDNPAATISEKIRESFVYSPLSFDENMSSGNDTVDAETMNKNNTANDATESCGCQPQNSRNTEADENKDETAPAETSDGGMRTVTRDGHFYINGIDAEEYAKKPDFAALPDEIRREALIHLIRQRQAFDLSDLKDTRIEVTDGAYSEEKLAQEAAKMGFILLPTDLFGKSCNPIIGLFELDESRKNVVRCPMGEACTGKINKNGSVTVKIKGDRCEHCPFRNDCKAKRQPRLGTYSFTLSPHAYDRVHTEAFLGSDGYKCVGRFRNGVETVPNMLHNYLGIDSMPIGRSRKKAGCSLIMMALNIRKFFAFVMNRAHIADNPLLCRA